MLKTIQITVPEQLLRRIDEAAAELKTSRSGLARQAFEETLFRLQVAQMERQDAAAYALQPQDLEEVTAWGGVQDWGDA
jgi:metal-responsive CopG/Arc/MetJ family transcriptional regulator